MVDWTLSELYHTNGYDVLNPLTDFRRGTLSDADSDGVYDIRLVVLLAGAGLPLWQVMADQIQEFWRQTGMDNRPAFAPNSRMMSKLFDRAAEGASASDTFNCTSAAFMTGLLYMKELCEEWFEPTRFGRLRPVIKKSTTAECAQGTSIALQLPVTYALRRNIWRSAFANAPHLPVGEDEFARVAICGFGIYEP